MLPLTKQEANFLLGLASNSDITTSYPGLLDKLLYLAMQTYEGSAVEEQARRKAAEARRRLGF